MLTYLQPLDRDTIAHNPDRTKNSLIKQYIKLFKLDDIELSFDEEAWNLLLIRLLSLSLGPAGLEVDLRKYHG
jgi:ATP-dependent Clp protease ATP-binding subunit ClpX